MTTINEKIAQARKYPYIRVYGNVDYSLYDETRNKDQADLWAFQLRRRGYKTEIHTRIVDDFIKGKFWEVYDVFFTKTRDEQP